MRLTPAAAAACFADMARERMAAGWKGYLLTFQFDQLPGSDRAIRRQQLKLVDKAYHHYVTRVVRKPRAPSQQGRLPVWIAAPDLPVPKHAKQALRDLTVNDGWHVQGLGLHPPWSRHVFELDAHFRHKQADYIRPGGLRVVRADLITHHLDVVCEYVSKMLARRRIEMDDVLVLPKTRSEMDPRLRGGRQSSLYG